MRTTGVAGVMLSEIIAYKRQELAREQESTPLAVVESAAAAAPPVRDFAAALRRTNGIRVLAEVKRGSPSEGIISDASPSEVAREYERGGAHALSVLTDRKFFRGEGDHLRAARSATGLPVLRKDFTLAEYHVHQARALGADAILLMAQVLSLEELTGLLAATHALGMTALVEGHSEAEIERAVAAGARVIGINNRDLTTMDVDLFTTEKLRPRIPADRIVISQSGVSCRADVERLAAAGADAVQVGTSLMRAGDIGAAMRELFG